LEPIGQDRGYLQCTHWIYFSINGVTESSALQQFNYKVFSIETENTISPEEADYEKRGDSGEITIVNDPQNSDNFVGKAIFKNHQRSKYYHFKVVVYSGNQQVGKSEQKVYIRSGFPEIGAILGGAWWEKGVGYLIYAALFGLFVWGIIAIIKTSKILNDLATKDIYKIIEDNVIKNWNDLARTEHVLKEKEIKQWDVAATKKYKKLVKSIKGIPLNEKDKKYPIVEILESGLKNHSINKCSVGTSEEIDRAMYNQAEYEESKLRSKYFESIHQMAIIAPSWGLLGTVIGISLSFKHLSDYIKLGYNVAEALAPQIYLALITTICGLIIAITLTPFYNGFNKKISEIVNRWNKVILEIGTEI